MSEFSGADIEGVISGVKRAIRAAQASGGSAQAVNVEMLELTLRGIVEKGAGGELKIKIPIIETGLGGRLDITSKELQTIQLTLVPVKGKVFPMARPESFETELVKAIKVIREGIKNAAATEPKFTLQSAVVELNFAVNSKGEIAFLATGSGQSELMQSVKLYLGPM